MTQIMFCPALPKPNNHSDHPNTGCHLPENHSCRSPSRTRDSFDTDQQSNRMMRTLLTTACCLLMAAGTQAQNLAEKTMLHVPLGADYSDYGPGYLSGTASGSPGTAADARNTAGQAYLADGTDDQLSFGSPATYQKPLPISFSVWVYLANNTDNFPVFNTDNNAQAYAGVFVQITAGKVYVSYGDGADKGSGNRTTYNTNTVLNASQWYHLAGVVRGYNNIDLYIDGVKHTGGTYTGAGSPNNIGYLGGNLSVGWQSGKGGPNQYFKGRIDDLHLWNRELSAHEIMQKYRMLASYSSIPGGMLEDDGPAGLQLSNTSVASAMDRYGRWGHAFYLDGSTSRLTLPANNTYKQGFPLTISAWVKLNTQKVYQPVFTTSDHSSNKYSGLTLYIENGKPAISSGDNAGAGIQFRRSLVAPDSLRVGNWYQIVAVCNSITDFKLYVNGKAVSGAAASGTGTTMANATGSGYIGYLTDAFGGANRYFHGSMDEVMLFSSAFTAAEVGNLYRAELRINGFTPDTLINPASTLRLRAAAASAENISYQWQKRNGSKWQNVANGTSATYNVATAGAPDTGIYRCVMGVTNYSDSTSVTMRVGLQPASARGGGQVTEIVLSPNPADGQLHISGFTGTVKAEIRDMQGRLMLKDVLHEPGSISLDDIPAGSYIISLRQGNLVRTEKLIIQ